MNKARMKNVALTLFVLLTLTMTLIPMAKAVTGPAIQVSPGSGPVPCDVTVTGWGFTPCGNVEIWWDLDGNSVIERDKDLQLGVAQADHNGYFEIGVTIPESFYGSHVLAAWDIASGQGPWVQTGYSVIPSITLIPSSGPVGTPVTVKGTGFGRPGPTGLVADVYWDYYTPYWFKVVSSAPVSPVGSFTATFNVPQGAHISVYGEHGVHAKDRSSPSPHEADNTFWVEPKIVLDPTQGPADGTTVVTIRGTGFDYCYSVDISLEGHGIEKWWNGVTQTNGEGKFTYQITLNECIPNGLGECYPVKPGLYYIDARTGVETAYAEAPFIVTPWFNMTPTTGPVGTLVKATGWGFTPSSTVDIVFEAQTDITVAEGVPTDSHGNFHAEFNVPEVPEKDDGYLVRADGVYATDESCDSTPFIVLPWIWITPSHGNVGDTVTVVGKGWDTFRNLGIIYGGIGNWPPFPIPSECIMCAHMALWWAWEETPKGCNIMGILQPWGWAMVQVAYTNEKGSFEVTFEVPESTGGYHPIYAGECLTTGWPYKMSANVPVFRVEPKIWIEGHEGVSEGLSESYVTLYGTGFSYVEAWFKCTSYPEPRFDCYFRVGTLVLDFDSNKQWINEFNFIMNNEYDRGWQDMYWVWLKAILYHEGCPMFPEGYLPLYLDLNGTISHGYWWYWLWQWFYNTEAPCPGGVADMSYKGCPSLKVPVLEPGSKDVLAYYFGLESSLSTSPEEVAFASLASLPAEVNGLVAGLPAVLEKPIENPMGLLFGLDDCGLANVHLGKIYTDTATTSFTIKKPEVAVNSEEILSRLDKLEATVTGLVKDSEGKILAQIKTSEGNIVTDLSALDARITGLVTDSEGHILAKIETSVGTIQANLTALDAKITGLVTDSEGHILAKIDTAIGTIQANLTALGAKIVSLDDIGATVETALGPVKASLDDLHSYVTVDLTTKLAKIETDIGTLDGKLVSMEGKMATIETDVGTITTKTDLIVNHTGSIPVTIALSLIAAIAAIAAAVLILRKVYIA
jgi:hypothetical protein